VHRLLMDVVVSAYSTLVRPSVRLSVCLSAGCSLVGTSPRLASRRVCRHSLFTDCAVPWVRRCPLSRSTLPVRPSIHPPIPSRRHRRRYGNGVLSGVRRPQIMASRSRCLASSNSRARVKLLSATFSLLVYELLSRLIRVSSIRSSDSRFGPFVRNIFSGVKHNSLRRPIHYCYYRYWAASRNAECYDSSD